MILTELVVMDVTIYVRWRLVGIAIRMISQYLRCVIIVVTASSNLEKIAMKECFLQQETSRLHKHVLLVRYLCLIMDHHSIVRKEHHQFVRSVAMEFWKVMSSLRGSVMLPKIC